MHTDDEPVTMQEHNTDDTLFSLVLVAVLLIILGLVLSWLPGCSGTGAITLEEPIVYVPGPGMTPVTLVPAGTWNVNVGISKAESIDDALAMELMDDPNGDPTQPYVIAHPPFRNWAGTLEQVPPIYNFLDDVPVDCDTAYVGTLTAEGWMHGRFWVVRVNRQWSHSYEYDHGNLVQGSLQNGPWMIAYFNEQQRLGRWQGGVIPRNVGTNPPVRSE